MKFSLPILSLSLLFAVSFSCNQTQKMAKQTQTETATEQPNNAATAAVNFPELPIEKLEKSDEEWKAELSADAYYVLRQAGTERAFTGPFWNNKEEGIYVCRACQLPLFDSSTKFKSGTGWPSYYEPIQDAYVTEHTDNAHGMTRTEVVCARCDGHLGHVFNDGPAPTGLRYCINGISLDFVGKE